ncbi:MAG: alcohol dehydrogenase catalytic domain-containing protein, partial [Planctomycetota bacterium]
MRCAVIPAKNAAPIIEERPDPTPAAGEVVVAVRACALNHRDVWIAQGLYPGVSYPVVAGSDAVGEVIAVGAGVDQAWIGRDVIINPGLDWGTDERAQAASFTILGSPRDGTLAEQVAVPVGQVVAKPEHLDWAAAAALPL